MDKIDFIYMSAENFLCFEKVEFHFKKHNNIVCIKAENLDTQNPNERATSNGVGKSSIPEIPVYALYGETIKKPKKLKLGNIINNKSDKDCVVEFIFGYNNNQYRIVRTIKNSKKPGETLSFWKHPEGKWDEDGADLTNGDKRVTQAKIVEEIKLNYSSFLNIYIFTDDNTTAFLESDAGNKRTMVENLLSLEKYRSYFEVAKDDLKTCKDTIKKFGAEYDAILTAKTEARNRLELAEASENTWRAERLKELEKIEKDIQSKNDELRNTDNGAALAKYTEAQETIADCKKALPEEEEKKSKITTIIEEAELKLSEVIKKHDECNNVVKDLQRQRGDFKVSLDKNQSVINDINNKVSKDCPYCLQTVDESKFLTMLETAKIKLLEDNQKHAEVSDQLKPVEEEFKTYVANKEKLKKGIETYKQKLQTISKNISEFHSTISRCSAIKPPETGLEEQKILGKIEELKKQAEAKKKEHEGVSPYEQIKQNSMIELTNKSQEAQKKKLDLETAEKELPYYEFWFKAFGDSGIRKYVIDGIIPALNNRIVYWLQYLIDNKIKLEFDNQLDIKVDRYPFLGRPYVYEGMSGGQRRRLILAVSQAFAYIRELSCGSSLSAVFLDEVSMNMDESGVEGIYRMICELAKDKQVFIIDHNPILLQMLDGCDVLQLQMHNEVTSIVNPIAQN